MNREVSWMTGPASMLHNAVGVPDYHMSVARYYVRYVDPLACGSLGSRGMSL